ncbi:MAG: insulinase family protein, partial [Bacteroidales bacterium]|nr:insulinase family protein [Bacteroidales bacterium]
QEKVFLDSIMQKYDLLAQTTDAVQRKEIQMQINELSLKAGEFAIPNELDKLLDAMGATNVNAFTSNEIVAYFNEFPVSQMDKWLALYSHRFKKPVFRLFQSELETVFEEKNMYSDQFQIALIEQFMANFYKKHPYGTQTVIGTAEHIKNPSLSVMQKMYDTYYVANNMALILSGNFVSGDVMPKIEKYFGKWKDGKVPEYPKYEEEEFKGVETVEVNLSPIKIGALGYRTVKAGDDDELALNVCEAMLNNSSSTGYLDKLMSDGKLMGAQVMSEVYKDYGGLFVIYVPKILGQKFEEAEALVVNEINRLRTESIDKEFLENIKLELVKNAYSELEDQETRVLKIGECFIFDKNWDDVLEYPERIKKLTADDVKRVAEKYLNANYLAFHSKMGFPHNEKLEKPGFDPVIPKNAEAVSAYAEKFSKMKSKPVDLKLIVEGKDFIHKELHKGVDVYYSNFDQNDIFEMSVKFHTGLHNNPLYGELASYLKLIGSSSLSFDELNKTLQKYAASFSIDVDKDYFTVSITGFNKFFDETVKIVMSLITEPYPDQSKLAILNEECQSERKMEKESIDDLGTALFMYGIYGENSPYLRRVTQKQVAELTVDDLFGALKGVHAADYSVTYSGNLPLENVLKTVGNFQLQPLKKDSNFPTILPRTDYAENTVLFLNNSKALQSKIYFYVQGNVLDDRGLACQDAFNQYFGTGMSSLVFQEIREFRSMAYSAYAVSSTSPTRKCKSALYGFVGTQCDKTVDAVSVMCGLINSMPVKKNRFDDVKNYLQYSLETKSPSAREIAETVDAWKVFYGDTKDPRKKKVGLYDNLEFQDIVEFYEK